MFEPAGGGFGEYARKKRRMTMGCDQRLDAEGCSAAHDRTEIMRVRDLVEHEDNTTRLCDVGDIAGFQCACFDEHALVYGLRTEPRREVLRRHDIYGDACRGDFDR